MMINIARGEPVNAVVEVNSDQVVHTEKMDRGGRLMMENGDMIALNGPEWEQWIEANAWPEEVVDVESIHHKKGSVFTEQVRDKLGQFKKGKKK